MHIALKNALQDFYESQDRWHTFSQKIDAYHNDDPAYLGRVTTLYNETIIDIPSEINHITAVQSNGNVFRMVKRANGATDRVPIRSHTMIPCPLRLVVVWEDSERNRTVSYDASVLKSQCIHLTSLL